MRFKVGCCGLAGLNLRSYGKKFEVVELQSTFYRLPRLETASRWRDEVPRDFEFTIKAFQGTTHLASSPTWRKAGTQLPKEGLERYGHLQTTEETLFCWKRSLEICKALSSKFCVVQLPPSFVKSKQNMVNVAKFFEVAERPETVGVEFRHKSWYEDGAETATLLKKGYLVHIVNPLISRPLANTTVGYYRLHGLGKQLYKYQYSREDLQRLKENVNSIGAETSYVMFNNVTMLKDAMEFLSMLE